MTRPNHLRIAIIGAGLTGLLVANGLDRLGIQCDIFEQEVADCKRRGEWSMGIHWSLDMLKEMIGTEKSAQLVEKATVDRNLDYSTAPANGVLIYDGVSGEVLKDLAMEGTMLRVSRRNLRTLLMEGVNVQFESTLRSLKTTDDKVELTFSSDGRPKTYDIVIGCDGPKSTVRALMYGNKGLARALTDSLHFRNNICYHDADKARHVRSAHPVVAMAIHPEILPFLGVQDAHESEDPAEWTFTLVISWSHNTDNVSDSVEGLKLAKEKAETLCEPFRSAICWIPDDTGLHCSPMNVWVPLPLTDRLVSPRVVLAGDSAHPMPPFRGQGFNHAIQDAHNLVKTISSLDTAAEQSTSINAALDAYAEEVRERGSAETKASILNGEKMRSYHDFKSSPYAKRGLSKG